MAGIGSGSNSSSLLLNPYQNYGNGIKYNFSTGRYEADDNRQSVMLNSWDMPSMTGSSDGDGSGGVKQSFWDWMFTPSGGANTKSPAELGLNALSAFSNLYGTIYSTNKQVGAIRDQIRSNETLARANLANSISDAAYNRGNYMAMVNGWGNQEFTNQVGQNTLSSLNSLTQAGNTLGVDSNLLNEQKQQVKSYMKS